MGTPQTPHFAAISVPAASPRAPARHSAIQAVSDDIFMVRGKMPSTAARPLFERIFLYYSRTMTIVRSQNNLGGYDLTIINSIRLDEKGLAHLAELGQVKHVVRLGAFHGVDDAFYVQQFGAKYWVVDGMINAEGLESTPEILSPDNLPIPESALFTFNNLKYPEAIMILTPTKQRSGVAITVDAIQNHTSIFDIDNSPLVSFIIWKIGLYGAARLGPIWMRNQVPGTMPKADLRTQKIKARMSEFFTPQFERLLTNYDFDMLMPGHGWPILKDAKHAIKTSMARQL